MLEPASADLIFTRKDALVNDIGDLFSAESVTIDYPEKGYLRLRGTFLVDLADRYDDLRTRFEQHGYTPLIRHDDDDNQPFIIALPTVFKPTKRRWEFNLLLFLLTIASTMLVGSEWNPATEPFWPAILTGWPFSAAMLGILGAHELGHYFAARYHKVDVSLPYFIPFPTILGTMGAVIIQRSPPKNRRVLLDVGAAGPLFGLIVAFPVLFFGLATSELGPVGTEGFLEGNSLMYALAKTIVFGEFLPANGMDVYINQVALAGWAGLLVTAINLIPVGQLDGGHMAYVLFGKRAQSFLWPAIIALVIVSLLTGGGWLLWAVLLYFFGRSHAEPLDDITPLDPRRRFIAWLCLALFIVLFVPTPITDLSAPQTTILDLLR